MVYFIKSYCNKYIKIGTTSNLKRRMIELQAANPKPLTLLGTIEGSFDTEATLHLIFAKYRVQGEWFRSSGELKALQKILSNRGQGYPTEVKNVRDIQLAIKHLQVREAANRKPKLKKKLKGRIITKS